MSLILYIMPTDLFAAYFCAVFIHETGHLSALKIFRLRIRSMIFTVSGCIIEHQNSAKTYIRLLCALAGPGAGIAFAYTSALLGKIFCVDFLNLCAGISLVLSVYNLLPCKPLDGAVALENLLLLFMEEDIVRRLVLRISLSVIFLLGGFGIYLMAYNCGFGLTAASLSLLVCLLFEEGIVKRRNLR